HAGEKSTAADWDNDRIDVRHLLEDFQTHRALAGNDRRIVVAINVSESAFLRDLVRLFFRLAKIPSMQDHGGAELFAVPDFNEWRVLRHYDGGGNAEQFSLVGERLGMITGRSGDHTALLLIRRELGERVPRAAFLEAACPLFVIEFREDLHPRELAQR